MRRWLTLVLFVLFLEAPSRADRLVTSDGRILTVQKARKLPDGNYQLTFANGEVLCPAACIQTIEIEGDMSDYVPQNEDERKKLEQGFVRYRGKWMSKSAYSALLGKESEERSARIEELSSHSAFYNAYEKETQHFLIKTNTSPELLDYYADLLEAYYELMESRVGINPTPTLARTKMRVNIYRNYQDWVDNNEAGMGGGVVGFFSFLSKSLNFFYLGDDPAFTEQVGLHEATHLLTYLIDPTHFPKGSAIWVNEGIAEYFGSAAVERSAKGKITITPGQLLIGRILTVQEAIKRDEYCPLEKLLDMDATEFGSDEYAHAWSFIYFLNNSTKQYESGFKRFFKDFYTIPKSVEYRWESFPNMQGTAKIIPREEVRRLLLENLKVKDVAALEKEWVAFISAIEIDGPKALFERAYDTLTSLDADDFDRALTDIDGAITKGYAEARAYWVRGLLKGLQKNADLRAGMDDLRKAVEMSPLDARFRYSLGQALSGDSLGIGGLLLVSRNSDTLKGEEQEIEEAKKQLALTCELDPENDGYKEGYDEFLERYERWKAEGTSQK